jgi:predicted DCC family thiol-disulfide oxidoreductase YuxK
MPDLVIKPPGIIVYDGRCGLCSSSNRRFSKWTGNLGFTSLPYQHPEVQKIWPGNDPTNFSELAILVPPKNSAEMIRIIRGFDAILYALKQSKLFRPLAWIGQLPGVHWLGCRSYRIIAKRRYRISQVCRLRADISE